MSENEIQRALLAGDPQDQLVIAYNLVIDNKRIADEGNLDVIVCHCESNVYCCICIFLSIGCGLK